MKLVYACGPTVICPVLWGPWDEWVTVSAQKEFTVQRGKAENLLIPGRDSNSLLRLAERSGVCGRLVAWQTRAEVHALCGAAGPVSPAINFPK